MSLVIRGPAISDNGDVQLWSQCLEEGFEKGCHGDCSKRSGAQFCKGMAHPRGFEPLTSAFGGQRSIQLSYGCVRRALSLRWP